MPSLIEVIAFRVGNSPRETPRTPPGAPNTEGGFPSSSASCKAYDSHPKDSPGESTAANSVAKGRSAPIRVGAIAWAPPGRRKSAEESLPPKRMVGSPPLAKASPASAPELTMGSISSPLNEVQRSVRDTARLPSHSSRVVYSSFALYTFVEVWPKSCKSDGEPCGSSASLGARAHASPTHVPTNSSRLGAESGDGGSGSANGSNLCSVSSMSWRKTKSPSSEARSSMCCSSPYTRRHLHRSTSEMASACSSTSAMPFAASSPCAAASRALACSSPPACSSEKDPSRSTSVLALGCSTWRTGVSEPATSVLVVSSSGVAASLRTVCTNSTSLAPSQPLPSSPSPSVCPFCFRSE
eukprot:scaffold211398_cov27-Tisochrysis_lutea.AAC.1